jgi:type III restriction enzyme
LLDAQSFNATTVKENISIMVMSYASLRVTNKEERKSYQDNSNYASFFNADTDKTLLLDKPGVDEMSLINVIRLLNPVCIIDESHNAESGLSVEMLKDINPSFILDLTATPKDNSNIISVADSMALKKENMVKLPVVVYNHNRTEDVIDSAITLQRNLEKIAIQSEANGGNYIRPIVLFQAQSKGNEDNITYQKLKEKLVKVYGLNEKHIAIKTATINEIKQENLLSKGCEIRYIITVNALKEGWDCPFAYILATIANRSTPVEVEQILGRILRLPNATVQADKMLNMSYVFTSNSDFQKTLDTIVAALNKQGFNKHNSRDAAEDANVVSMEFEKTKWLNSAEEPQPEFPFGEEVETEKPLEDLISNTFVAGTDSSISVIAALQKKAGESYDKLKKIVEEIDEDNLSTTPITPEMMQPITIRDKYQQLVKEISLPQFMRINEQKSMLQNEEHIMVDREWLLNNFKLSQEGTKINFDTISVNIREVDLVAEGNKEYLPQAVKINAKTRDAIVRHINSLSSDLQLANLASFVIEAMGKMPPISQPELKKYTQRVIEDLEPEKLAELKQSPELYAEKLKKKVQEFMNKHAEEEFEKRLTMGKIILKPSYQFPESITLIRSMPSGNFGLYQKEEAVNSLENKLKGALEIMDNIEFWHRNLSRKGFEINGNINHYPDFIVYTQSKKFILIETKGDHLNEEKKIKLGNFYTKYSGQQIHYFMVFENNAPAGAYDFDAVIDHLGKM